MHEDIKELIENYKKYSDELEIKIKEFRVVEKNIIDNLVIITKEDNDYCEDLLENSQETTISLLERIPEIKSIVHEYKKIRDELIDVRTKKHKTIEKIAMIIRQITGINIERCKCSFVSYDEIWLKIMEYINKLEKNRYKM